MRIAIMIGAKHMSRNLKKGEKKMEMERITDYYPENWSFSLSTGHLMKWSDFVDSILGQFKDDPNRKAEIRKHGNKIAVFADKLPQKNGWNILPETN